MDAHLPYGESGCHWMETGWKGGASCDASAHPVAIPTELWRVIMAWPAFPRCVPQVSLTLVESTRDLSE
jgi:hypothetical protein